MISYLLILILFNNCFTNEIAITLKDDPQNDTTDEEPIFDLEIIWLYTKVDMKNFERFFDITLTSAISKLTESQSASQINSMKTVLQYEIFNRLFLKTTHSTCKNCELNVTTTKEVSNTSEIPSSKVWPVSTRASYIREIFYMDNNGYLHFDNLKSSNISSNDSYDIIYEDFTTFECDYVQHILDEILKIKYCLNFNQTWEHPLETTKIDKSIDFKGLIKRFLIPPTYNIIETNPNEINNRTIEVKYTSDFNFTLWNNKSLNFGGYLKRIRETIFKQSKSKANLKNGLINLLIIYKTSY